MRAAEERAVRPAEERPGRAGRVEDPVGEGGSRNPAIHLLWIVSVIALGAFALRQDRSTVERGNRLFRDGNVAGATEIYRGAVDPRAGAADSADVQELPTYNLGTALLGNLDPRATRYLEIAGGAAEAGGDSLILQRSHYNLGTGYLRFLRPDLPQDSALLFVTNSISHSRAALHQDPADADARWNLAVAQRSLDSLLLNMADVDLEQIEGEVEDGIEFDDGMLARAETSEPSTLPPPEGAPPDPDQDVEQDENDEQASIDGAREALSGDDPGPIGATRAREILTGFDDDPAMMVRGILWIHRPDINWWEFTPYPGGDF